MKIGRDRPRTDPSSVSDLGTGFRSNPGSQTSGFSSTLCRDSFAFSPDSQFQLDQLIETPLLGPDFVSSIVSSIEPRISICLLNMNLNKGRD